MRYCKLIRETLNLYKILQAYKTDFKLIQVGKMNVGQIKKLDEESYKKLKEGPGPADTCLCGLLAPPHDNSKKNIK
ncbi:Anthranilate/para-aminobenzoate synthases component II [Operophtera brumata]|uniref:Anthranilate/para-aminobenzoate synthases component II n=1 Tax=Operophtera brumata TaxID=104452 RepID=A0A0L7L4W2_OPEBR|nr:Anthranilate/para-aminobenzoate synthases component II [Operophtera brumata]